MEKSFSASYAAAGVDITAGYKAVELMKQSVARTNIPGVMGGLGGFGGLFELDCTKYAPSRSYLRHRRGRHQAETGFPHEQA